jgi:hypothetical protein
MALAAPQSACPAAEASCQQTKEDSAVHRCGNSAAAAALGADAARMLHAQMAGCGAVLQHYRCRRHR